MLHIEKPELLNVIEGPASVHGSFTCRPSHVLVFKRSGESVYRFADRSYTLSAGQAMFIPQGSNYTFGKTSEGENRYILINFHGQVAALCGFDDPLYFSRAFHRMYGQPPSEK